MDPKIKKYIHLIGKKNKNENKKEKKQ